MTFDQIVKDIHSQKYAPVYFLHGEEPYFIDQISDLLEARILDESEKSFDQTVLYGRDVDKAALIGLAKGFPMMARYQVIIVKEAQDIKNLTSAAKAAKSKKKAAQQVTLEQYLENPSPSTILVFCHKYKTIDSRTTLAKLLDKKGVLFESKKLQDYKIAAWIGDYVKQHGYTITPPAMNLLAEYLGNDLSKISNELEKLYIDLPKGGAITEDLIEKNIGISKDYNVFELQKAVGTRNLLKVNRIIHYYGANPKDNPIQMVIPVLFKFFTKVLVYHRLPDKSKGSATAALGVNPYFLDDYINAARVYPQGKLLQNIHVLREYDMRSKGFGANPGNMAPADMYKEMLFQLMF